MDLAAWQVRQGKLYRNPNRDILKRLDAELDGNIAKADKNHRPGLVRKDGLQPNGGAPPGIATGDAPRKDQEKERPS